MDFYIVWVQNQNRVSIKMVGWVYCPVKLAHVSHSSFIPSFPCCLLFHLWMCYKQSTYLLGKYHSNKQKRVILIDFIKIRQRGWLAVCGKVCTAAQPGHLPHFQTKHFVGNIIKLPPNLWSRQWILSWHKCYLTCDHDRGNLFVCYQLVGLLLTFGYQL